VPGVNEYTSRIRGLRAVLLGSAALTLAAALPARAQDATWLANPGSAEYSTGSNWDTGSVPTGTATFGASSTTTLTINNNSSATNVDGWAFNVGGYNIINNALTLQFNGAGISGSAAIANQGTMGFYNNSTAGNATITGTGTNASFLSFFDNSTAGSATVTNGNNSYLDFYNNSTAGSASITNNNFMDFQNSSSAGNATIVNNNMLNFYNSSTGGGATITNNSSGTIYFGETATAGNATINNTGSLAALEFYGNSTAGSATIINTGGFSVLTFHNNSTAGSATIVNNASLDFVESSTASSATITNNYVLSFWESSTAGNASIANSLSVRLYGNSTAGNAQLTNNATNAVIDFSSSTGPNGDNKLSAGSIAGDGTFSLGANQLTVGSNNLSTEVIGVVADGGLAGGAGASLVKVGTGMLTLSGTNTYTGATTVNGGTLAVNGDITASSGVTVNSGGTLGGTGTVGNTLISGGTFAPGSGTAGSSMNVNGTLGFSSASTYAVYLNPTTASFATVSGAATLAGAAVNAIFANGSYVAKQYTILTAGSINGTFGTLTNTNLPINVTSSLSYDETHAYLNLALSFQTPAASGLDGNQSSVGNALTNYFNTNGGIPIAFMNLNANGLSQTSGQPGASTAQTGSSATGQFVNAVFGNAFDGGTGGGGAGALGFAEADESVNENAYAPKRRMSREAKDAYAAVTPRDGRTPTFEGRWSVFASIYGGNNRVGGDATAGTNTTTSRTYGTVVGADYRFTPATQAGFALGGAGSSFDVAGGFGGGKAEIFNAAVYGRHDFGAAYVAGALTYSWQDTTTDRTVTISGVDKLHASFKAQALAARIEGGWRYATPFAGITPYTAVKSTSFFMPAYAETATSGSNQFALSYASKTTTNVRTELGAKFDKAMLVQGGVFTLTNRTAWAHDSNTDSSASATFQSLPGATFTTGGATPSPNAALISLGAEMKWHNGWSVAGLLDGEFSRTTTGYTGKGTVRYAW
jgi:autotransporter-associated beta strand protein